MSPALLEDPHHDGAALHVADDAPRLGATVPVFVRVPHTDGARRVWVRTTPDAEPRIVAGQVDRMTASETWWRCDVDMHNPVTNYRFLLHGGPRGYRWLNGTGTHAYDVTDASDFRLITGPPPPPWARDAIVYQIFPDRFARSAAADGRQLPDWAKPAGWDDTVIYRGADTGVQVYGGDLDGIAEHLDHVASLGANTLYLTPVFPAESNHRYNASNFDDVDPLLGGDKALARLAQEVHARGWRMVGDLTANHCGDTHPWFRTALAKQLSGGQRQRVAMGRAIVREPQVFLMDEPLSNLDAKLRVQMRSEISQVHHDLNVTTIYVTHDQAEAMTMGDRVALKKAGVLQQVGNPQFLYDNPDNIFVAGFIGSPPMNMALGRIERDGDDLVLLLGPAKLRLPPAVLSERPALASYVGRNVAAGIRSEDMEDARLVRGAEADSRLHAVVSLTEALGSSIVVHFDVDAPKVVTEDTKLLEKDVHTDEVPTHGQNATRFVAAFAPRSRVRPGDDVEVVVDTVRMHFFDPATGNAIRG
jgi:ABC-type sugar transport system ATPase subunit